MGGLYTSANKGTTWTIGLAGWHNPLKYPLLSAFDVDFVQNHTGSLAFASLSEIKVGFSSDSGNSWNVTSIPTFPVIHDNNVFVNVFALSPAFDVDQEIYLGSRTHGVLQTFDGGINWRLVPERPLHNCVNLL